MFKDGFTDLTTAGDDGLVNTADDGAIEELRTPGADGLLGNTDDLAQVLTNFQRQIAITHSDARRHDRSSIRTFVRSRSPSNTQSRE